LREWNGPVDGWGSGRKDLAAPGRRRWLGAHSLASGEGFHRYMPWCRVVWSATGAFSRPVGVVAVALRIRQLASGRAVRGRRPAPPARTCAACGARAAPWS